MRDNNYTTKNFLIWHIPTVILGWPNITAWPQSAELGLNDQVELVYQMVNYNKTFVEISVVKDDVDVIDLRRRLHIIPEILNTTKAIAHLSVSSTGQYVMCVNFSSDVSTPGDSNTFQCSNTAVTNGNVLL